MNAKVSRTELLLMLGLAALTAVSVLRAQTGVAAPATPNKAPVLINTCLITNDVKRLTAFYEHVLEIQPHVASEDYVEFPTGVGVLAIFSASAQEKYIPGSAQAGQNKSAVLQFRVDDVDQEYGKLREFVKTWVKPPTNQPWGTRSIYFRDPDGNLVDFFTFLNPR
jgi:catechol 2,3-dioxygenase-like lactoylglutathione lyase family enzyme